ncbi:saccharopine dehydrogenase NADP-binding domain-containing protein [Elstera litoralis]|uniref:saccharopine dehydrogenase NADP-binding domain-containing protein n=1 Tax=Elstera litoralis TaxID=552518 RepID=UPI000698AC3D|nr:saccharopine dehydrogenase NADP-binding domain-containing protein [Elstera litoralis]
MTACKRVVIIGGTGVFGKRLARHICAWPGLEVVLTSRSAEKAQALAAKIAADVPGARISGVALDHRHGLLETLTALAPWAVVDASGPFQGANYATAKAALLAGAHVLDLADARDYLAGYAEALNALALAKGLVALAGASSTPALSGAVVAALTEGWARVDTVDIAITPGGQSEVGPAVIEAILTYAGKPIPVWRNGALAQSFGWGEGRWGAMSGLGRRLVAAVETLDPQDLGPRYKVQSRVRFSAGLESLPEQLGLMALARLRRWGFFQNVKTWVPWLLQGRRLTRLITSDRGGMLVDVTGLDAEGRATRARWSLLVGQNHGPNIPTLPAAAALKALLSETFPAGARAATEALPLAAIEAK